MKLWVMMMLSSRFFGSPPLVSSTLVMLLTGSYMTPGSEKHAKVPVMEPPSVKHGFFLSITAAEGTSKGRRSSRQ